MLKNYLIKDLGILGSSANHTQQALEPVEDAREPTQDKNEANIILYLLFLLSILIIRLIVSFIIIIW